MNIKVYNLSNYLKGDFDYQYKGRVTFETVRKNNHIATITDCNEGDYKRLVYKFQYQKHIKIEKC